jgi:hypothetical protein
MKTTYILLIALMGQVTALAQSYQAIHGSNFAGSLSTHTNPASGLSHPKPWDITLMGLQVGNSTNLLYLERYSLGGKDKQLLAFMKNGDFKKRLNNHLNLNILNARIRLKNRLSIGIGANIRSATNASSSSYNFQDSLSHVNSFLLINDANQPLQAKVLSSSWAEVYGNLSYNLLESKYIIWNVGANVKANRGLFGASVTLDNARYSRFIPSIPVYRMTDVNLAYTYSGNMDQWDPAQSLTKNLKNFLGNTEGGFSFDLGTEWYIKDQKQLELFESKTAYNYTWKFGVSLLDLGYTQYKHGQQSRYVSGIKSTNQVYDLSQKFDSTIIDLATFNDSLFTLVNTFNSYYRKFKIAHPTRLVVNIDRPISDVFSINAELSLPVSIFSSSKYYIMKSLASLTITPRMEGEKYGAYMPMTINSYGNFWLGSAIKAGPLLFGIHNILPFFQKTPYPNGGGYLAYTISPSEKLKKIRSRDVRCPN